MKVSVIVPAYNEERLIGQTLDQLLPSPWDSLHFFLDA